MKKIYVVGSGDDYACWMEGIIVNHMKDADLVVFTGGEDVSPTLYNKKSHPRTSCNIQRDMYEKEKFLQAKELNKKIIGICRGAQFLCVMAGGILVQDQSNPEFIHDIQTFDGETLEMSSTHHQAAYPFLMPKEDYKILGWTKNLSSTHWGQNYNENLNPPVECEVVYYPKINALGIQGHPEIIVDYLPKTIEWCQDILNKLMNEEL